MSYSLHVDRMSDPMALKQGQRGMTRIRQIGAL